MGDLILFLISLINQDVDILALFGADPIAVTSTYNQTEADFPCIYVQDKDDSNPNRTGDSLDTQHDGEVRIRIETKLSSTCPEPLKLMWQFESRIAKILFGDRDAGIPSLVLRHKVGDWVVTKCRQVSPTGTVADADPLIKCFILTLTVGLSRP